MVSAAILIGTEAFGAAWGGGWAFGLLLGLGDYGTLILQGLLCLVALAAMAAFIKLATAAEPFVTDEGPAGDPVGHTSQPRSGP